MFLWLVVGCLLPTRRVNDSRFIDRRATIFVKVASCHRDLDAVLVTVALFKTLMSESSFFGKCPQSHASGVFGTRSS